MMPNANQLAREFSKQLGQQLSAEQLRDVVKLNAEENNSRDICHSHDFCDANVVMLEAMAALGVKDSHSVEADALWNEAWQIAKERGFTAN